ncbi:MAG: glycosyltransferase family 2 protein, partial [Candidatus Latescibacterota bacterium]
MEALFALSVGIILYTYVIYPLIIVVWGTVAPKPVKSGPMELPVSVVVAVRNGEHQVRERIDNLLAQDYPQEHIEVIVVSNGSTDRTVEEARSVTDPRVRVIEIEESVGKSQAINVGVRAATHDIVVFADVRQQFDRNAISELTAAFYDANVGAVSGELVIQRSADSDVAEGVGLYWEYEKLIRRKEGAVGSVVGATGSIYAIRKHLFTPLVPQTILDDFIVPMRVVLAGQRVVFSSTAIARDWASDTSAHEFARKVRTLAGNFQAFALEKNLLLPWKNPVFFQMLSHKIARLIVPYCLILAFFSNLFLQGEFFDFTLLLQVFFYLLVALRFTPVADSPLGGIIRVAWTFIVL